MFRTSLRRWLERALRPAHQAQPSRRSRPMLELLERRDAPAVYRVTGTSDGDGIFQGGAGTAANPFRWTTLRGALDDVNVNHAAEANTIRLSAGLTYQVTLDQLSADLAPGGSLDLRAVGKGRAVLQAIQPEEDDSFRVLEIGEETTAVLRSLVLTGGRIDNDNGPFGGGGGILNRGTLSLVKSVVTGNESFDDESKFAQGGGIANFGTLRLNRSVVRGNAVLDGPSDEPEPQSAGMGGGIANLGSLTLVNRSVVAGNSVTSKFAAGGGISQVGGPSETVPSLSLSRSIVSGNLAQGVASQDSEISKFSSIAMGGGIFDFGDSVIDIRNSTVADNLAHGGDAFFGEPQEQGADSAGWAIGGGLSSGFFFESNSNSTIHIVGSTFAANRAVGGDSDSIHGGSAFGGGLSVFAPQALLMINSTISGNLAQGGAGDQGEFCCGPEAAGGGLFFAGEEVGRVGDEVETQQTPVIPGAHLVNVTVTGNLALANQTENEQEQQEEEAASIGGGIAALGGPITLWNTIVAQNFVDASRDESREASDVFGDFISTGVLSGHNLIGNTDGSTGFGVPGSGDITGTGANIRNARLAPLANNGGFTRTHALRTGSPAIDAGDDAVLGDPFGIATDQRGLPRKSGKRVDIGAFEVQVSGTRNRRWNR
jgi:hypothetical protein